MLAGFTATSMIPTSVVNSADAGSGGGGIVAVAGVTFCDGVDGEMFWDGAVVPDDAVACVSSRRRTEIRLTEVRPRGVSPGTVNKQLLLGQDADAAAGKRVLVFLIE